MGIAVKILKTLVSNDSDGDLVICDTIRHEGKLWLVPYWYENIAKGYKFPARIIRMDALRFQNAPDGYPFDFVLSDPLPKQLLNHLIPVAKDSPYEVVDGPKIRLPLLGNA
jgi:hypothetical protein